MSLTEDTLRDVLEGIWNNPVNAGPGRNKRGKMPKKRRKRLTRKEKKAKGLKPPKHSKFQKKRGLHEMPNLQDKATDANV